MSESGKNDHYSIEFTHYDMLLLNKSLFHTLIIITKYDSRTGSYSDEVYSLTSVNNSSIR